MKNLEDTGIKKLIKLIKSKFESLAKVATSGSYTDLSNKPTVPTKVSELTNDKNFITASDNVATATKLKNARKIALSGGATGTATSFDGSANITIPVTKISPEYIGAGYIGNKNYLLTHPESNYVIIPFINNDIAYLTKRGGSVVVKYDDVVQNIDISAVFDGSASYWGDSTLGTKAETVTIELTLHRTFTYGNTIYIDNGQITWHAKDMTVEVMNTNYADDVWTTKGSVSNYDKSQYYIAVSHTPVGASNTGGGFNKVRLTFSNFKSNSFRIAAIGVIGYNSAGLRETFLPKDGGSVYGNILPYTNNSYNLGSSSNKWSNVYSTKFIGALTGNADTATKWATARNINGMTVDGTANRTNYGTCSTAADTAAKTVDCTGFELVTGAEITVKFTVTNTATEPTLNVNGTGAKPIQYRGSYILPSYLANGRVYTFRYDGENYELVGDINTDTNTDTKVTQTLTSTDGSYPLLLAPKSQTATKTTTAYFDSGVTLNPSTNTIAANISGSAGTASKWATARNINGMLVQGDANRVNYGVCSTAATTAAKTVDCAGFTLITGAEITVKFTNTNSAAQPTLNVNNQGAKAIYYRGNYIPPTCLAKDRVYTFRYDGTNYELVGDINTDTNTDTKNTAGSTDTSSKIFLIGAKSQAANPQTYSHDTAYVGTDGCLYSGGAKVSVDGHTHTKSEITDFPTSLKNPNGLRVQVNGDGASEVRYDGSVAKTINIKAGSNITITSDSSGNITISSTASAGSVTGDVGTVVYEASSGGLYCDGKTANNSNNSVAIEDSSYKYKRLRFYCQGYYGLICVDMPLDRECAVYETGNDRGKRYGGVIFPTAENGNIDSTGIGPSNHMYYELKWRVEKEAAGWRVRVVDSGWLGFNAGITSNANYTGNSSAAVAGTNYISWNQRHNNGYCIYKIVAYTD